MGLMSRANTNTDTQRTGTGGLLKRALQLREDSTEASPRASGSPEKKKPSARHLTRPQRNPR